MSHWNHIQQEVTADANNSSTTNITGGGTFTGIKTSTLGVAGIQVSLKTNKNCTVYVDQSPDGDNWDIQDSYSYYYSELGQGWTIQAINSYTRVRVTNNESTSTGYFRLQTALCPIVEAMPRSLDQYGFLKVSTNRIQDQYGFIAECSPTSTLRTNKVFKLVGAAGSGTQLEPNFWTSSTGNGGNVTEADGSVRIRTNTTASGYSNVQSVRNARYVAGTANYLRIVGQMDAGVTGNVRRWGAFNSQNGAFYELAGTTFKCVTRKNGIDTPVTTFNGKLGAAYTMDTNVHTYEIYWTNSKVYFSIGDVILHTVSATTATWSTTMHLPIRGENVNTTINTDISMYVRVASINRLGEAESEPTYKYISGAGTTVLRYSPGKLHKLIISDGANGSSISIYDGVSAAGTLMAVLNTATISTVASVDFECPYFTGLTIVVTNAVNFTVIYE
jgi:hypothetical protein